MAYADDVQGREGDIVYSVQGNILTGAAVLEQAAGVFGPHRAAISPTRLMRALAAGADNEQGDIRCTPDGIPSDGAFIRVDLADGSADALLTSELQVDDTAPGGIQSRRCARSTTSGAANTRAPRRCRRCRMRARPVRRMAGYDAGLDAGVPPGVGAGAGAMDASSMSAGAGASGGGARCGRRRRGGVHRLERHP